ncbi:hypothetical protein [Mangrovicoccus ximenensis]|uniref:hypothetical protein n=1 Tax=Mangrovicoccus ximenensis TaxID=1911570 RepID=UPI001374A7D8|nr:hypothetical protein [Mangrovicoccus ximenensis]
MRPMLLRLLPVLLIALHVTQAPAQSLLPGLPQASQQETAQDSGGSQADGAAAGSELDALLEVLRDDARAAPRAGSPRAPAAPGAPRAAPGR